MWLDEERVGGQRIGSLREMKMRGNVVVIGFG
jgi:hypothetical protein